MGRLIQSKNWWLALAVMVLVSCSSETEGPSSINDLYRASDQHRLRLLDVGCEVIRNSQNRGEVRCYEESDAHQLLLRSQVLKEWAEFIDTVLEHPRLPQISVVTYESLQELLFDEAHAIEEFVVTRERTEAESYAKVMGAYEAWSSAVLFQLQRLDELGCHFSVPSPPEAQSVSAECRDTQKVQDKLEIWLELKELSTQGKTLIRSHEAHELPADTPDLLQTASETADALHLHLLDEESKARSRSRFLRATLATDYGVVIPIIYTTPMEVLPFVITLPENKRTQDHVDAMVELVREYVQVTTYFLELEVLGGADPGHYSTKRKRLLSAQAFLEGPLDLRSIRELYEPKEATVGQSEAPSEPTSGAARHPLAVHLPFY